jgi:hypothetical protein
LLGDEKAEAITVVIQGQDFSEDCNITNACNPMGALTCIDSKCDCIYDWMVYSEYKVKCISTVNRLCDLRSEYRFMECIDNASCVSLPGSKGNPFPVPTCICDLGYVPVRKSDCDADEITDGSINFRICCPKKHSEILEEVIVL